MSVSPRGMSIQEAYSIFRKGNFQVNRRYQRKLVWIPDEKEALVDSILSGYPIPLILLAFHIQPDSGAKTFEILDGMQRLNAIFSFIENELAWNNQYFDLSELSRAKQLADEGKFAQRTPLLSKPSCARFLEYTLAVTEFPAINEEAVNQVFSRINSYGRQLSDQEKRQAGVVTPFANVVREIAADIRGDVSQDTLDLADMPQISITTQVANLTYGIAATETFWCKQGVLRPGQLRDSEDEQMIADLAISILEAAPFAFSGLNLDEYYRDNEKSRSINDLLAAYGPTELKHRIVSTISILRTVVESVDPTPRALARIVHPNSGSNPIKTAFYAIFMAFFDLCIRARKSPGDHGKVLKALTNLQNRLEIAAGQITAEKRESNIKVTKGLVQDHFVDEEPPTFLHSAGAALQFENALRRSRMEASRYECKQGLLALDATRALNTDLLDRLINTICGIANIGPGSQGAIFLGVADSAKDKYRVEQIDGIAGYQVGERYVVGINREATKLGESIEQYAKRVVTHVRNSELSTHLRLSVLSHIECISYRGHEVLCIWIPSQNEMSYVGRTKNDGRQIVYLRQGSDTIAVNSPLEIVAVADRFRPSVGLQGYSEKRTSPPSSKASVTRIGIQPKVEPDTTKPAAKPRTSTKTAAKPRAATKPAAKARAATKPAAKPRAATKPAAKPRAATKPAAGRHATKKTTER